MNGSERLANSLQELSEMAQKLPDLKGRSLEQLYKSSGLLLEHVLFLLNPLIVQAEKAKIKGDSERSYVYLMRFAKYVVPDLVFGFALLTLQLFLGQTSKTQGLQQTCLSTLERRQQKGVSNSNKYCAH